MINQNIKLDITQTGQIVFYGISEHQFFCYKERLKCYDISYKVIDSLCVEKREFNYDYYFYKEEINNRETWYQGVGEYTLYDEIINNYYIKGQVIIIFEKIDVNLLNILKNHYLFKDNRKSKLPKSKEIIYFFDNRHIICGSKKIKNFKSMIKNHFNESGTEYRFLYIRNSELFILNKIPLASQMDINNHFLVINDINHVNSNIGLQEKIKDIKEILYSYEIRKKQIFIFGTHGVHG